MYCPIRVIGANPLSLFMLSTTARSTLNQFAVAAQFVLRLPPPETAEELAGGVSIKRRIARGSRFAEHHSWPAEKRRSDLVEGIAEL